MSRAAGPEQNNKSCFSRANPPHLIFCIKRLTFEKGERELGKFAAYVPAEDRGGRERLTESEDRERFHDDHGLSESITGCLSYFPTGRARSSKGQNGPVRPDLLHPYPTLHICPRKTATCRHGVSS
jgi:hypothetical protein